jgi:hypothetical protein
MLLYRWGFGTLPVMTSRLNRPSGPVCYHCGLEPFVPLRLYGEDVTITSTDDPADDQATVLAILASSRSAIDRAQTDQIIAVRVLRTMGVPWSVICRQAGLPKSTLIRRLAESASRATQAEPGAAAD